MNRKVVTEYDLKYDLDAYRKIRLGHEPYGQSLALLFFLEAENL